MNRKKLSLIVFCLGIIFQGATAMGQPVPVAAKSELLFFALGDHGSGSDDQRRVAAAMEREAEGDRRPDFILLLGDNFYNNGVSSVFDPQWRDKFETIYDGKALKQTPFYAVLGNHDHRRDVQAQVQYSREKRGSGRWIMPDRFYSVDLGRVKERPLIRLVGLDTLSEDDFPAQARLVRKAFAVTDKQPVWRMVAGHHPLFSVGLHGPRKSMHPLLLPSMRESKTDIYFSGHDHNLQLIAHPDGPLQVVSGSGGKSLYYIERESRGLRFAEVDYGFVKVRVNAEEMQLTFINADGRVLFESVHKK